MKDAIAQFGRGYATLAVLGPQWALGLMLGIGGIKKIAKGFAFVGYITERWADTILPQFALQAFGYAVPIVEVALAVLLLSGVKTRQALVGVQALMLAFIFGNDLIGEYDSVAHEFLYLSVASVLLWLYSQPTERISTDSQHSR